MSDAPAPPAPPGDPFLRDQTEDGTLKIDVRFEGETVWLLEDEARKLSKKRKPPQP